MAYFGLAGPPSLLALSNRPTLPADSPKRAKSNHLLKLPLPHLTSPFPIQMELFDSAYQHPAGDAAAFALSRLPHPDSADASNAAFIDSATSRSLCFIGLRRAALALSSGLRLGLGLRRGDAVLILSPNSLLFPPIVFGVFVAGGVVITADPDATAAEIAAVARHSTAVIIVAAPEVADKVAGLGIPVLLTSRSLDPRAPLSVEELIDGGDPTASAAPEEAAGRPCPPYLGAMVYTNEASKRVAMTHADLIEAMAGANLPAEGRVCLTSCPMWTDHGLAFLTLGLPAARVTTVLISPFDVRAVREAVVAHSVTDVAVTPEVAAALAAGMTKGWELSTLRRAMVVPPLTADLRQAFRRRLPWIELMEMPGLPETETEPSLQRIQVAQAKIGCRLLTQYDTPSAAVMQQKDEKSGQVSAANDAADQSTAGPVPQLKKIQKFVFGDNGSKSTMCKDLRKHPETWNRQAVSKL